MMQFVRRNKKSARSCDDALENEGKYRQGIALLFFFEEMAKSLRSKFKRKIRSIARSKKAHKEHALLEGAVARREEYEREQAGIRIITNEVALLLFPFTWKYRVKWSEEQKTSYGLSH
ncbi:hypothetical protein ANCCAN_29305 [Ancylostoma caninum]|uniref:Uncharacterized protein n=1 Tax=Ancylostoma caninum TaxID=29170 RepID=A0A368EZ00_ANCCA|nr:hypothetical protein ANCCAN_29305 [Ancylostoma caninum]